MDITRRRLLSFVPAAALLTAVKPSLASADACADTARLMANTVAIFAGTPESNARPEAAAKLAATDQTSRTWLSAMNAAGAGQLFAGLPLGTSDPNLTSSYQHLYEIAVATRRPGGIASAAKTGR